MLDRPVMKPELEAQLSELATKLGTSAEHLWSVLIRQAYIDGISSLLTLIGLLAFGLGAVVLFSYMRKKHAEALAKYVPTGLEYVVLGFLLAFVLCLAGNQLFWVISDFFNPEFYAWRQLPFTR